MQKIKTRKTDSSVLNTLGRSIKILVNGTILPPLTLCCQPLAIDPSYLCAPVDRPNDTICRQLAVLGMCVHMHVSERGVKWVLDGVLRCTTTVCPSGLAINTQRQHMTAFTASCNITQSWFIPQDLRYTAHKVHQLQEAAQQGMNVLQCSIHLSSRRHYSQQKATLTQTSRVKQKG